MLDFDAVSIGLGDEPILKPFTFGIDVGDFVAIVGPSGSGKSTLLNFISGFVGEGKQAYHWFNGSKAELRAQGGLQIKGAEQKGIAPQHRAVAMISQQHSVYPHMTALENIAFPLTCQGLSRRECRRRAAALAAQVYLEEACYARKALQLSGGEQQRVAMAKMLARGAELVLLDEPFGHLDPLLRQRLMGLLMRELRANGHMETVLMVTHDWLDLRVANKAILIVDKADVCDKASSNVLLLEKRGNAFEAASGPLSPVQEEWLLEMNRSLVQ